ncbi:MAG: adenosylcobinamide-GDP ribazoletransferase [Alphaproteobacteria bacterium]|nr:adenosylcobinamide-GDP ribazoletransferase [Alphaproteobacteria bacterium]
MTGSSSDDNFTWFDRLRTATMFYTRLPIPGAGGGPTLAQSSTAVPVVGAVVGAAGGIVFALALSLYVPSSVAALLAIGTTLGLTGALHEDGLADTADGLGAMLAGGRDREAGLSIMRDSRIGSFGVLALILSVGLRAAALSALPAWAGAAALIAAHAGARGLLPMVMVRLVPARADGLAVRAGRPESDTALVAAVIGTAIALAALGLTAGAVAMLAAAGAAWAIAALARRLIGGYTGDVLGAIEQAEEIAVLIIAATLS